MEGQGWGPKPVRRSYRPCSSRVVAMHNRLGRLPAKTSRCSFAYFCCQFPQTPPDAGSDADRNRLILATNAIPAMRATSTNTVTGVSLRRLLRRRSGMRLLANQLPVEHPTYLLRVPHAPNADGDFFKQPVLYLFAAGHRLRLIAMASQDGKKDKAVTLNPVIRSVAGATSPAHMHDAQRKSEPPGDGEMLGHGRAAI